MAADLQVRFPGEAVVVTALRRQIAITGGKPLAEIIGVSYGNLMSVADGKRHPGSRIGRWMGYELRWESIRPRLEGAAFAIGDPVQKKKGFPFKGVVIMIGSTIAGEARYVVEHAQESGLLHIYSEAQLETRPTNQGEQE